MQQVKDIIDMITDFLHTSMDDADKYVSEVKEKKIFVFEKENEEHDEKKD